MSLPPAVVVPAVTWLPPVLQVLIYQALGFTPPVFGHMSLILAPDKSKLSKRHGATSVGDFKGQVGWDVGILISRLPSLT